MAALVEGAYILGHHLVEVHYPYVEWLHKEAHVRLPPGLKHEVAAEAHLYLDGALQTEQTSVADRRSGDAVRRATLRPLGQGEAWVADVERIAQVCEFDAPRG